MNMTWSIGWEYLKNRQRQTILSLLGVIMGVTFFIAIASMMTGMHNYFIEKLIDTAPHVKVMDEFRTPELQPVYDEFPDSLVELRGLKPKAEIKGIRSADAVIAALKEMPGVTYSPVLQGQVFLRYGGKDVAINLMGITPELERSASNLERDMIEGDLNSLLTNSNGILIGKELARKMVIRKNATLNVISPAGIVKHMKVVGLFKTGISEMDSSMGYAMLKKVQILQERENRVNQINIRLQDVDKAPSLAADIEGRFGYRTESWQETFANIFEMFMVENIIMYSTVGAIMLVAGFGIFNIISTSVNDKRKDIGILKSIGFSEKDIMWIFVVQGVVVGVAGTLIGWVFGAMLIELFASYNIDLGDAVDMPVTFDGLPMLRSVWLYIISGAMALVSSVLSAYFPARKAAELNPVEIIRGAS